MSVDANQIGQEARRRGQFARWLVKAWSWAGDCSRYELANRIEELLRHSDEEDYPLWDVAAQIGVLGDGKIARLLRKRFGIPVMGPKAVGWDREINFSPIIALDASTWDMIYNAMTWANRTPDVSMAQDNFYLWSPTGNIVRFIKKKPVVASTGEDTE